MATPLKDYALEPELPDFKTKSYAYKTVSGVAIGVTVHIPQSLITEKSDTKHPVIVRYHGGFLHTGGRVAGAWPTSWVLKLGLAKKAVVVTADYRLLPEARGTEILDDLRDSLRWVGDQLAVVAAEEGVNVDTQNVLVTGESAGGWCSLLTTLNYGHIHPAIRIRACLSIYGVLDIEDPFYTTKYEKIMMGVTMQPSSILDEQVARVKSGEAPPVCPGSEFTTDRRMMAFSAVQNGRYLEYLGRDKEVLPFAVLDLVKAKGEKPPPIWLLHGQDDTAVPWEGSERFANKVKAVFGDEVPLLLTLVPGEHAMDNGQPLDTGYLVEGRNFFEQYWG